MKKLATIKMLLCGLFLVISGIAQAEGDAAAEGGVAKAEGATVKGKGNTRMNTRLCIGCHGIDGFRTAFPKVYNVPKIGGQHSAYLVKALQAYKTGARSHPTMRAIAADLSQQDMEDLAAYYAGK